jgi:hypothetical protein
MPKRDYTDMAYTIWRRKVRARDGGCCQWPGCTERNYKKQHIHHIRSWAQYVELRYDVNNGITLCKLHHKTTYGNEVHFMRLFLEIVRRNNERTNGN